MTTVEHDIPAAVAATVKGTLNMNAEDANAFFSQLLSDVTKDCVGSGATMIGHVKSNISSGNEMLSISSTTDDGNVRFRSKFTEHVGDYEMTLNVIVYGISNDTISKIIADRTQHMSADVQMLTESCNDPECNDPDCVDGKHRIIELK